MKNQAPHSPSSPAADDRLMDAMLLEHARLGSRADEFLLARLEAELDPATATATASPASHPWRRIAGITGIAAAAMLAVGIVWKIQPSDRDPSLTADQAVRGSDAGNLLTTELPPELIEGTPVQIRVPRLVAAPTGPPTMRVPEGTVRLSLGKPVTSSDPAPLIGSLDLITDGEKDAGEGYYVELDQGLQWVQIDLEQMADIHAVWVWHYHSQRRAYNDVIIQISDDPAFERNVTTVFNNDFDNSAGMGLGQDLPYVESRYGLLVDAQGTPGRYVRLHSNGNTSDDSNHYVEVEVFGVPR